MRPLSGADTETLFIVAAPRSGSTWLLRLLAHHPRVVGFQFSYLLQSLKSVADWWVDGLRGSRSSRAVLPFEVSELSDDRRSSTPRTVDEVVERNSVYGRLGDLARSVYDQVLATKPTARLVVDHGDGLLEIAPLILELFPQSRFLHLVRDPRSVYASRVAAVRSWSRGFSTNPVDLAEEWIEHHRMAQELRSRTSLVHQVKYEDLVSNGDLTLGGIFKWLDLDANPDLVREILAACSIDRMGKEMAAPAGFIRSGRADSWKREVPPGRVRVIERIAEQVMLSVGYGPAYSGAIGALDVALWRLRRQISALLSRLIPGRGASPQPASWP